MISFRLCIVNDCYISSPASTPPTLSCVPSFLYIMLSLVLLSSPGFLKDTGFSNSEEFYSHTVGVRVLNPLILPSLG